MKRIKKKLRPLALALAMCLGMCHGNAITAQAAGSAVVLLPPGTFYINSEAEFSDGLMPVQNHDPQNYGYVNTAGQLAIPCQYYAATNFSDGVALVGIGDSKGDAFAVINTAGQVLFSYTQQDVFPQWHRQFSEGMIAAWSNTTSKLGFMNKAGQLVVACQYGQVKDFSEGLAAVQDSATNCWGYVDAAGNPVIPCQYKEASSFEGGFAQVQTVDGRWILIDKSGRNVVPEGYELHNAEWNNFATHSGVVVIQKGFDQYLLDQNGNIVTHLGELLSLHNASLVRFSDGLAWNGNQLIDVTGRQIFAADVHSGNAYLGGGYSVAKMKSGEKLVDRDGNLTTLPTGVRLDFAQYSEGMISAYSEGKYGFVNTAGQLVVPCTYNEVKPFSGGVAPAQNGVYKWGLVDATGAEVLPFQYEEIVQVKGAIGLYMVRESGYYGIFSNLVAAPTSYAANGAVVNYAAQAEVNDALNAGIATEALGVDYRNEITRAQLASEAVKLYEAASGQAAPAAGVTPFIDVDEPAVTQAKELGLIDGLPDGTFIPNATVPKEQAAAILSNVSAKVKPEAPAVQAAKFEPEGSKRKTASIEETLATATRILKKIKK